jgi:hypothetical protein
MAPPDGREARHETPLPGLNRGEDLQESGPIRKLPTSCYISFLFNWSARYSACRIANATIVSVGFLSAAASELAAIGDEQIRDVMALAVLVAYPMPEVPRRFSWSVELGVEPHFSKFDALQ